MPQDVDADLEAFLRDVINAPEIIQQLGEAQDRASLAVIKFPLPLRAYEARLLPAVLADKIDAVIAEIQKVGLSVNDQVFDTHRLLASTVLGLETYLLECLPRIVRESTLHRFNFT
jgi:hypothetical protein